MVITSNVTSRASATLLFKEGVAAIEPDLVLAQDTMISAAAAAQHLLFRTNG